MGVEQNKMNKVKSCCCYFNLRTGCIGIASIGIILALSIFYASLHYSLYTPLFAFFISQGSQVFLIINFAWFCFQMTTWITLLFSAVEENATLVKISFALTIFGITVSALVTALLLINAIILASVRSGDGVNIATIFAMVSLYSGLTFLPIIAFYIYGSIITYSFYHELRQKHEASITGI